MTLVKYPRISSYLANSLVVPEQKFRDPPPLLFDGFCLPRLRSPWWERMMAGRASVVSRFPGKRKPWEKFFFPGPQDV